MKTGYEGEEYDDQHLAELRQALESGKPPHERPGHRAPDQSEAARRNLALNALSALNGDDDLKHD